MLWFTLGAIAGTAYASRVINKERLDLAVGEARPAEPQGDYKAQLRGYQAQLADMIDERAKLMGTKVTERGHEVAERIRSVTFLEEGPKAEVVSTPMPQVIGGRDDLAM
jgi:hypothetical protein